MVPGAPGVRGLPVPRGPMGRHGPRGLLWPLGALWPRGLSCLCRLEFRVWAAGSFGAKAWAKGIPRLYRWNLLKSQVLSRLGTREATRIYNVYK